MKNSVILGFVLFAVWMIWSGHTEPFVVSLGVLSCIACVWLANRMRIIDSESVPAHMGVRPFIVYGPWLIKEIVEANFDVARRILDPRLPIRPRLISVKASQRTELGRVILANSITLTPGTVSIDMQGQYITVHALSHEGAEEDLSGEMDRRVSRLEG